MRRLVAVLTLAVAVAVAVAVALAALGSGAPPRAHGQQLPTPRGHLGGREPLQPPLAVPSPAVPTPTPNPSPTPAPGTLSTPADAATPAPAAVAALVPEDAAALVRPAVVTVVAVDGGRVPATPGATATGTGTGFIIDGDGHMVTSSAVVGHASGAAVVLADGQQREATVVGSDPLSGVAVLRVEGQAPAPLSLATAPPRPGQTVVAVGTPFGELPQSVEVATVGAVGRTVGDGPSATKLIQLDASALPGVGGGPVVNLAGEVVGMRLEGLQATPAADFPNLPGIDVPGLPDLPVLPDLPDVPGVHGERELTGGPSFAVPSEVVLRVSRSLIDNGQVTHPFLGAATVPVTPLLAVERGFANATGALVEAVEADGPAERAGIGAGDVILSVDGVTVDAEHGFGALLLARRPGETTRLVVRRSSGDLEVDVVLGERPDR